MSTALQQIESVFPNLNRMEKAQLLQWLVSDLAGYFPGIRKDADVNGGEATLARTRIPVFRFTKL